MRLSKYFLPLIKENPKEAEITSHRLMLRSGMIRQQATGIYTWLPLGKRVLDKVCTIIKEEQERAGSQEILMSTVQSADLWRESGRYEDYGKEMLRIKDRQEREMLYGPTNEEMVTDIFRTFVRSYKSLPLNLYQLQWKFRDEVRPRFGVMRSREFLMKDAYSFDLDEEGMRASFNRMFVVYLRTFARMGVRAIPMRADTGPIGGDLSYEFIILADTGESAVYCDNQYLTLPIPQDDTDFDDDNALAKTVKEWTTPYAATEEMHEEGGVWKNIAHDQRTEARGIEVGHIFSFGTKYSTPMGAMVTGKDGKETPVLMGSYGIGPSRLVAAIIEACHDDYGITWPREIAPFDIGIINMKVGNETCDSLSEAVYTHLQHAGFDCLLDDSKDRAGAKFATMDLIGLPLQLIVGPRGAAQNNIEVKIRETGQREEISVEDVINYVEKFFA